MDREQAQNEVYHGVTAAKDMLLSEECVGATIDSAYWAFTAAADYGPNSPEVESVAEYTNDSVADACPRAAIPEALDLVEGAHEQGLGFFN